LEDRGWRGDVDQVPASTSDRNRINIGGVELDSLQCRGQRNRDGGRTTTQLDNHWSGRSEPQGVSQQKQSPLSRYEYARLDANPQSGELGPTNYLLQRESVYALPDHVFEIVLRCGSAE
jgi:hypothetical protein